MKKRGVELITAGSLVKLKAVCGKNCGVRPGRGIRPAFLSAKEGAAARKFHGTFYDYRPTPLTGLDHLAGELGVGKIFVKDESARFGLNAFKVLGGSLAIGKYICRMIGADIETVTFDYLKSEEVRQKTGWITFCTATDGNHGRGVAWAARQIGQDAVIYLPKGTARRRIEAIEETGARAYVTDLNYDDTVRLAIDQSIKNGWQMIQDTAWEGYTEIPRWIMQGYTTMAHEALEQLGQSGIQKPTHVFLQAGVGSLAAAILGYFVNCFDGYHPVSAVVEPENADCFYRSALAGDGKPRSVGGDLNTIMAGLACGEPSPIAWEILRDFTDMFISCPDCVAARGMRMLASPAGNDRRIVSGESGAVGIGLLSLLMQDEGCAEIRRKLNLGGDSVVLVFSTEGDTDPVNYRRIVWDGRCPMPDWPAVYC
ncbi:MAG: diaminopropionate ammonia-lyase [Peptococcaceae bacterium]|nr:diaminopropionate ammonia-lyase [Peptococcaceae bacterium]